MTTDEIKQYLSQYYYLSQKDDIITRFAHRNAIIVYIAYFTLKLGQLMIMSGEKGSSSKYIGVAYMLYHCPGY